MKKILWIIGMGLAIIPARAQNLPSYVPTENLVGWWSFSGDAQDGSGHGHNGMVNGAQLSEDRFGTSNSCYAFNGINNSIYIPTTGVSDVTNYTVTCWLYYSGDAGATPYDSYFMFGDRDANGYGHTFALGYNYSAASYNFFQFCQGSFYIPYDIRNQWHHVAAVNKGKIIKIFVDGEQKDSLDNGTPPCTQPSSTLWFGAVPSDQQYLTGKMDDIGFWDRALDDKEIKQVYSGLPLAISTIDNPSVSIFPNPAINSIAVSGIQEQKKDVTYRITDIGGKTLQSGILSSDKQISIQHLSPGIYLLQMPAIGIAPIKLVKL